MERILRMRKQLKIWEILLGANVKKIMGTELFFRETYLEYGGETQKTEGQERSHDCKGGLKRGNHYNSENKKKQTDTKVEKT